MELVGYDDVEARSHEVFSFVVVHSKVSSPLLNESRTLVTLVMR